MTPFDQVRISQLVSNYGPDQPPSLPLEFGDYLSILWRLDQCPAASGRAHYYRKCEQVLANALGFADKELGRLVRNTQPGLLYESLGYLPYRSTGRVVDAADRRAAIEQLLHIRADVLRLSIYEQQWHARWPGSGILDTELRERMFAVLFTALPSQLPPFARLLLVIDIVLQELLTGTRRGESFLMHTLVGKHGYPDPENADVQQLFARD